MSTNSEHSWIIAIVKATLTGNFFLNFKISGIMCIFFKCVNVDVDNEDEPSPVFLRADC